VIQACRGSAGMWLSVVTVRDVDVGECCRRGPGARAGEPCPGHIGLGRNSVAWVWRDG